LLDAYTLENFTYFFVDFEYDCEIGIHCLDGSDKLGWSTILHEDNIGCPININLGSTSDVDGQQH
jgi:hypothetical protein